MTKWREKAGAIRNKGLQRAEISDNVERKGRDYMKQGVTEGGEVRRQYGEERQRLYETRGDRARRIGDNTERKGRGYTK